MAALRAGVPFDQRTLYEVVLDYRREGIPAWPYVHPQVFWRTDNNKEPEPAIIHDDQRIIPLSSISSVKTIVGNENGYYLVYDSDEFGFQNPVGMHRKTNISIAVLGDSFVHGEQVSPSSNAVSLIQDVYPATVNLGSGGHGPLAKLGTLREYGSPLRPNVVFWVHCPNDFLDLSMERDSLLQRYLEPNYSCHLRDIQPVLDKYLKELVQRGMEEYEKTKLHHSPQIAISNIFRDTLVLRTFRIKLNQLGSLIVPYMRNAENCEASAISDPRLSWWREHKASYVKAYDIEYMRNIILCAQNEANKYGARFIFVYLPTQWSFTLRDYAAIELERKAALRSMMKELGILFVDIELVFSAQSDPLNYFPFRLFGHFNEEGYRLMAEEMMKVL